MKKLSLLALLLLGACNYNLSAPTADPVYLPDGTAGYRVTCSGYFDRPADCIREAGDVCGPNGYQMFDASGRAMIPEKQNDSVIAALNTAPPKGTAAQGKQSMFIKCRPASMSDAIPVIRTPAVDTQPIPLSQTH